MTYREAYLYGKNQLAKAGVPEADLDARLLLEYICDTDRNTLYSHPEREVCEDLYSQYCDIIEKRAARIPLQHLTGTQEFMGLPFIVNDQVLIPRQDTENLVEEILRESRDDYRILDLCTGSGCILLSLLKFSNRSTGIGADLSPEALKVAELNAGKLNLASRVRWIQGDLYENLHAGETFDLIVSNPPYIATKTVEELAPEVRDHEPRLALDGGEDGLFFYRRIIEKAPEFLTRGGSLWFEIGYDEQTAVTELMEKGGFTDVKAIQDYQGNPRVVCGKKI